ncbi:VOC family protein [Humibacter antri]
MSITTAAHLNFRGNARQALEFYHSIFGGQLMIATYAQFGVPHDDPNGGPVTFAPIADDVDDADHVAFGAVVGENGFRMAAYDVYGASGGGIAGSSPSAHRRADGLTHQEALFLLLNGETLEEISPAWDRLTESEAVIAALTTPGSGASQYGMLTDLYGVTWIFGISPTQ